MHERDDEALQRFLDRADAVLRGDDSEAHTLGEGARLGCYRLLKRLGQGGMGVVWLAKDEELKRLVALKVLASHMTVDREAIWRFGQEATAAARLTHANIVTVHTAGEAEGVRFLVMDYVDGVGLDRLLALLQGRRPQDVTESEIDGLVAAEVGAETDPTAPRATGSYAGRAVAWASQVAEALHHAHTRGVLHRDIKPSNLLVDGEGNVRVVDFGLARVEESAPVTRTGAILGTLTYMAPEALAGRPERVDARADVYSLGAVLFELLAFRPPFISSSLTELVEDVNRGEPPVLRRLHPTVPRDLALVVGKCLAKERDHRYATAHDLAQDLQRFRDGRPVRARPAGPVRRARYWARRHPAKAVGVVAVLFLLASIWPVARIAGAVRATAEAAGERRIARDKLTEYLETHGRLRDALTAYVDQKNMVEVRHDDRERTASLVRSERDVLDLQTALARLLEESRGALERASRIEGPYGGVSVETEAAFAEYYFFRYERAREEDDRVSMAVYAAEVERYDRGGDYVTRMVGTASLSAMVEPADAEVYLFRYESYAEMRKPRQVVPRLVPVPTHGGPWSGKTWATDFLPGDPCLVVTAVDKGSPADEADVVPGDLILRIQKDECGDGVFVKRVEPGTPAAEGKVASWDRVFTVNQLSLRGLFEWNHVPRGSATAFREVATSSARLRRVPGGRPIGEATGIHPAPPAEVLGVPAPPGGGTLVVLHGGAEIRVAVPAGERPGVRCETTAYPLICSGDNRIDPGIAHEVVPGSYLLKVRKPGFEDQLYPLLVPRDSAPVARVALLREGSTPPGCVWIPPGTFLYEGDPARRLFDTSAPDPMKGEHVDGFFIRRTELTYGEYFEFINDPATHKRIDEVRKTGWTILLPRHYDDEAPLSKQRPDGTWEPKQPPHVPVLGISNNDIRAYLAWYNARAAARDDKWRLDFPSHTEWQKAARGVDGRYFPWGNRWSPDLCTNQGARAESLIDQGPRFEPRDESPFGVADMAGSRREWHGSGLSGGSWGESNPVRIFRASYTDWVGPGYFNQTCGFRPVVRPR